MIHNQKTTNLSMFLGSFSIREAEVGGASNWTAWKYRVNVSELSKQYLRGYMHATVPHCLATIKHTKLI